MIVPPVFPYRSVSLFVPVSRSPFTPGLHQARPQLSVYIRFTIHFRFLFSHPFHVCLSVPVCISLTLSFPFTSGHHPLLIFLFASVSRVLVSPGIPSASFFPFRRFARSFLSRSFLHFQHLFAVQRHLFHVPADKLQHVRFLVVGLAADFLVAQSVFAAEPL